MAPDSSFESMCFNLIPGNDSANNSNQNSEVNFDNDTVFLFLKQATYHQARLTKTSRISVKNYFLFYI